MRSRRARTSRISRISCFWAVLRRGQAARDEVGEARRVLDVRGQGLQLVGEGGGELHHPLEEPQGALGQGLDLDLLLGGHRPPSMSSMLRLQEGPVLGDLQDAEALHALHHEAQRAVGELEHLVDVGEGPDAVEVALHRVVDRGVALGDDADDLALAHRVVHEGHGALPGHRQGQDGVGEQDGVPQGQDARARSGTSARFTSWTPPDSKSGARSSLSLIVFSVAPRSGAGRVSAATRRRTPCWSALEGPRLALGAAVALLLLLAVAAQGREGQGLEAGRGDLGAALGAERRRCLLQPLHGLVDLGQGLGLHLHEGEVDLLHEVVDALLLGVLHVGRFGGQGLAQRAQLVAGSRAGAPRASP